MMKKMISILFLFSALLFADEMCNVNGSLIAIPEGSCQQNGYICNLSFDVSAQEKVMAFYLASDPTCDPASLLTTQFTTTLIDETQSNRLHIFLIEGEEYHTDALGITLATSLALSASNNKKLVSVIYHKVYNEEYGGIRLQAISQIGN